MNLLDEYSKYALKFFNSDVKDREKMKQLLIFTNGTVDKNVNHRIVIYSVKFKYNTSLQKMEKDNGPIEFCCGSTWDEGPIGQHTSKEYAEWLSKNPTWTVEIV